MTELSTRTVAKRSGDLVLYDTKKICTAVEAADKEAGGKMTDADISSVVLQVDLELSDVEHIDVEMIQDTVENVLMRSGFTDTARHYIRYRQLHELRRHAAETLMESYDDLLFVDAADSDLKRDNANVDGNAPMGIMLKLGAEGAKVFYDNYATPQEFIDADRAGIIHIHDKDFALITFNCLQTDLSKVLSGGFSTGHGFLREPNSIRSAASLACISIQSSQNDMFGGQSINCWDGALAPYVKKSFKKAFCSELKKALEFVSNDDVGIAMFCKEMKSDSSDVPRVIPSYLNLDRRKRSKLFCYIKECLPDLDGESIFKCIDTAHENACVSVEDETEQAMEGAIHNFNTLHSRAGAQTPFSSINYGMDTSPEGRLVTEKTLDAIWNGLGHGETPIFPISIFQLRSGVNFNPGDPNYYLFQYACKVSSKRLFPNFLSLDSSFNSPYYKEGDPNSYVAAMGCRTRVMSNVNGPEESGSRGNFAFTTINLPYLALMADKNIDTFFSLLDKYIDMSKRYLEYRFEIIAKKKVKNFPFILGQKIYMGSEKLGLEDEIRPALLHSSISIGFCGLAECLVALIGKHHGESEEAQKLGLKIVGHIREMTDKYTDETGLNWSCFGTPAESTAGTFARACRRKFGVVPGVTDREYITNSSHCPVYYPTSVQHKIDVEAPYHTLENAGHIAYIELDGDPLKNVKAFENVIRYMVKKDMGYMSINHPVDRDPVCGYTGLIENECPHCHRREDGHYMVKTERLKD